MLLDILFGNRTTWKILFVLSESPGKSITRKDIRSLTMIGNKILSKSLYLLQKYDLILSRKIGKASYFTFNMSSPLAEPLLSMIRLEKRSLNNPDFFATSLLRDLVYDLTNISLENLNKVILFGSYAKHSSSKDSDLDVAIIFNSQSENDELLIAESIDCLSKRYKLSIQPHFFTQKEFNAKKQKIIDEIMKDGVMLF